MIQRYKRLMNKKILSHIRKGTCRTAILLMALVFLSTSTVAAQTPQDTIFNPVGPSSIEQKDAFLDNTAWYDPDDTSGSCNISGSAAEALRNQPDLDERWVNIIVQAAAEFDADPIAMASVLFWENRRFPSFERSDYDINPGRGSGPWQIIDGTWASHASAIDLPANQRPYVNSLDPNISTRVAAHIVANYGGKAGVPLGSLGQDFGRQNGTPVNLPSIATFAKNYNAGQATFREPGKAGYLGNRTWHQGSAGAWYGDKQKIIDDYIAAVTYAYYKIATNEELTVSNSDSFVQESLSRQNEIESFAFADTEGDNANTIISGCAGPVDGNIVQTAFNLAWDSRGHGPNRADAKPEYANPRNGNPPGALHTYNDQQPINSGDPMYSDCGVFVSTVMRASGADPDFPQRSTAIMLPYLNNSSNYQRIELSTDTSASEQNLRPGDILITVSGLGHIYLYTGPYKGSDGNTYNAVQASYTGQVPQAVNYYQVGPVNQIFVAFRLIKSAGQN